MMNYVVMYKNELDYVLWQTYTHSLQEMSPYKYTLLSNDEFSIPFSQDELEYCHFAKNIFTDIYGNWIESSEPLHVPPLNQHELGALRLFLQMRKQNHLPPRIREQSPVITTCPVYIPNENIHYVYKLIYHPAIITSNIISKWNTYNTGLPKEYHDFLQNTLYRVRRTDNETEAETIYRWIQIASFVGCEDLAYILQAQFAWCVSEALECYPKQSSTHYIFDRGHFNRILEDTTTILNSEDAHLRSYIDVFADMKRIQPNLARYIVKTFLEHRSVCMPCEEWTRDDWETFHMSMDRMYRTVSQYHEGE
jgi:hypothetical protein